MAVARLRKPEYEPTVVLGIAARDYLSERRRMGTLAAESLKSIRSRLDRYVDDMGFHRDAADVTRAEATEWLASLELSARSVRAYASAVRGLYGWLVGRGHGVIDPFYGVQLPRTDRHTPVTLNPDEVGLAFDAARDSRERLLVSLMVQEGLRAGEVVRLHLAHVDRRRKTMLLRGKGNKERTVPMTAQTERNLVRYLAEWPPVPGRPVIRSHHDRVSAVQSDTVSRLMSQLLYRAGVKRGPGDLITGHAFRRTAASDVLEAADGDIQVVKEFLGHESIMTTQVYLRGVPPRRLREAMMGHDYGGRA